MVPETMISGAYTAMSAAHAVHAASSEDIFMAVMYLGVALIYLIAPYLRKDRKDV